MRPHRAVLALSLAIVGSQFVPSSGASAGGHRLQFNAATSQPTELDLLPTGPRPELCDSASGRCLVNFVGYDRFEGALQGTQVNAGSLSLDFSTGIGDAVSLATFTGTIQGCPGPGTVTLRYTVAMGARPGQNVGTFDVVKDSGTGGLAAAQGQGTIVATPDPATGSVTSVGTLKVNCKHR